MSNLRREHHGHVKYGQLHRDIFHPPTRAPTHADIEERLRNRRIARAVKPPPKAPAPPVLFPDWRSSNTITDAERRARVEEYEEKKQEYERKIKENKNPYRPGFGGIWDRLGLGSGKGTTPTRKATTSTHKARDDDDSDDDDVADAADNTDDNTADNTDDNTADNTDDNTADNTNDAAAEDSDDGYVSDPMDDNGWGLKEGVVKLRI